MFGSTNPFGQSSSSPFGSQSVFGQTSNASNNPFAPKPFGSTSPFGSQTTASIFGSTSTGVFGGSSSLATTPTFGASSSPAFGSSAPAFGASSTPTFGAGSSSFGGSSVFGQKPAFGGFGSTPTQSSPFGSTVQQTQSAFGSSLFGSSTPAFGATSTPAFGATNTPAFGAPSTSAFGATSTPAFGSTSTPAFGSVTTPSFGSTGSAFGASTGSAFGSGGAFGASSTPAFGTSTTPAFGGSTAFGSSSTPVFGSPSNTPFGAASAPSFNFASTPTFGQSNSTFGSSQFGATPTAFGAQSSPFGSQSTTPAFGNSAFGQTSFGGQRGGSRVAAYTPTAEQDGGGQAGKLESISAMPIYKEKSHEELRWEDYQLGDKGGPNPTGQSAGGTGFGTPAAQSNPFGSSPTFGQAAANPFTPTPAVNPFTSKAPFGSSGFGTPTTPAFGTPSTTNLFSTNPSPTPSIFAPSSAPSFGSNTSSSPFGQSSGFGSTPSIFGAASAPGTTATFGSTPNFGNTQSAGLFQSTTPSLGQTNPTFGQTSSLFGQSTTPSFGPSIFGAQSTGFGGFSSNSTPSLLTSNNQGGFGQTTPTLSPPFQPTQTPQVSGGLFNNFGQTQAASSGFGGTTSLFGQGNFGQSPAPQGIIVVQPTPVSNPFGTLPAMPQMSIGRSGSSPSVQYGISSMPVTEKPAPVRVSSLLTSRHLSQRRTRLPARKYHPKNDGPKVPFYSNDDEAPSTPKADALYIPRENPRALVIHPIEKWPSRTNAEKLTLLKDTFTPVHENGKISGEGSAPTSNGHMDHNKNRTPVENDSVKEQTNQKANGSREDHHPQKGDSYMTLTGHRAGEAAIVYEHGADIEALMPKLRRADYYTEPRIQELAAKERAEPGFCHHVKDFVVGRQGYGSIKFIGETDVRRLDLESLVQFNNREVIVYLDDSKKPPVGQGLNKPAEVTLLNIKCFDKKTGEQYTAGPRVEKYKEMLKKKARDQGAEFVSYEPVRGEWKFRVNHFSRYSFCDDEDEVDLVQLL